MIAKPQKTSPTLQHELRLAQIHGGAVAGIDEAGRGPWAGPVVAAAVILDMRNVPPGIDDSKRLSRAKREALAVQIRSTAIAAATGIADAPTIDRLNILRATFEAMSQALRALPQPPAAVLIDGRDCPNLGYPAEALIGGDGLSLSVAAASILAKVTRDQLMHTLAAEFPGYGWERNMGYGTAEHAAALTRLGVTPQHRRSFAPVRAVLQQYG